MTPNSNAERPFKAAQRRCLGWGWQRNAYWLPDSGDVWFPSSGTHTIRVQTPLQSGIQIARLVMDADGANAVGNFDSIQFTRP